MNLNPVEFFVNVRKTNELNEAKFVHLRKLKLRELEYIANDYGILPDEVMFQTNPRGAYGQAIANHLDLEIIKKAVEELQ